LAGLIVSFVVLILLIGLFVWLATRAGRARRGYIKWPGIILSGLLALLFTVVLVVALIGTYKLNVSPYHYNTSTASVSTTQEVVARGQKKAILCAGCHSSTTNLPLDGSKENMLAGSPFGVLYAPNLTPGGPLKDWSDGEIIRAIREGVDKNGRPLLIMPSQTFRGLSDADVEGLVAYLRSQPAVNRPIPPRDMSFAASILVGAGVFPTSAQAPLNGPVQAPQAGTPEYGKYMANSYGCIDCHGLQLTGNPGGAPPAPPAAPNLTLLVPKMTEDQFVQVFRAGKDPTGRPISDQMPWNDYNRALTDAELHDLYTYIHSLPPAQGPKK
jgi:cytochrome c553